MKRSNLIKYGLTALSVSAALGLTSCATVPSGAGGNGATSTAQIQTTGEPGSPSATTTIPGTQLPAPDPAFGGVIKDSAAQSKPWWPPTVVPPRWLGTTGTCMPTKTGIFTITTGPPACRNTTATTAVGSPPANRRPAPYSSGGGGWGSSSSWADRAGSAQSSGSDRFDSWRDSGGGGWGGFRGGGGFGGGFRR